MLYIYIYICISASTILPDLHIYVYVYTYLYIILCYERPELQMLQKHEQAGIVGREKSNSVLNPASRFATTVLEGSGLKGLYHMIGLRV